MTGAVIRPRALPGMAGLLLSGSAVLALAGCASSDPARAVQPAHGAASLPAQPLPTVDRTEAPLSCDRRSGFMLSLVKGSGWASPVQAAQQFTRQRDPAGYGTPSTTWVAGTADDSGVTLTAEDVSLHAVRLPHGRWAIDSGQRCT